MYVLFKPILFFVHNLRCLDFIGSKPVSKIRPSVHPNFFISLINKGTIYRDIYNNFFEKFSICAFYN
jgi:hypothetical protein